MLSRDGSRFVPSCGLSGKHLTPFPPDPSPHRGNFPAGESPVMTTHVSCQTLLLCLLRASRGLEWSRGQLRGEHAPRGQPAHVRRARGVPRAWESPAGFVCALAPQPGRYSPEVESGAIFGFLRHCSKNTFYIMLLVKQKEIKKEHFMTWENYMKLNVRRPWVKFYWSTVTPFSVSSRTAWYHDGGAE